MVGIERHRLARGFQRQLVATVRDLQHREHAVRPRVVGIRRERLACGFVGELAGDVTRHHLRGVPAPHPEGGFGEPRVGVRKLRIQRERILVQRDRPAVSRAEGIARITI